MTAKTNPVAVAPARNPITPATPSTSPTRIGTTIALMEGSIISRCAPFVEIATQEA